MPNAIMINVYALDDVLSAAALRDEETVPVFEELLLEAATRIASEHCAGGRLEGGCCVHAARAGRDARLHLRIERNGGAYSALVVGFDRGTRAGPVLDDGMVLLYGERTLLRSYIAHWDAGSRKAALEDRPIASLGEARRRKAGKKRPHPASKAFLHRTRTWLAHRGRQVLAWASRLGCVPANDDRRPHGAVSVSG